MYPWLTNSTLGESTCLETKLLYVKTYRKGCLLEPRFVVANTMQQPEWNTAQLLERWDPQLVIWKGAQGALLGDNRKLQRNWHMTILFWLKRKQPRMPSMCIFMLIWLHRNVEDNGRRAGRAGGQRKGEVRWIRLLTFLGIILLTGMNPLVLQILKRHLWK